MGRSREVLRWLLQVGCAYELVALRIERSLPRFSGWVPPLSRLCHRYRWHRLGTPVTATVTAGLLWHLYVQKEPQATAVSVVVVVSPAS